MGVEVELVILLLLKIIGDAFFAPFELETPAWRKLVKWLLVTAITLGLYTSMGHWAALVPIGFGLLGLAIHITWCQRNGIHPLQTTPRRRYYELRQWPWRE